MLPETWSALGVESRAALVLALGGACGAEAAERLQRALQNGRDEVDPATSRQAQHTRTQRMLTTALAACSARAVEDPAFSTLFQRADFAALRPNSADAHRRFGELVQQRGLNPSNMGTTWEMQANAFLELASQARSLDRQQLGVLHSTLIPLFTCVIIGGPGMQGAWRALWERAQRAGLLDNSGVRVHLAGLGCFAGESAPAFEVQLDPTLRAVDFSTVLCLVRRDDTEDLRERIAHIMRGDAIDPADCMYPVKPASTIARAAEYIRGLMRQPHHFNSEGLILTLLTWAGELARFVDLQRDDWSTELESLLRELRRIEQVQIMEKTRFFRVLETMPSGSAREHLLQLWTRTHAA